MNGAQALIRTLVDSGVEVCFSNPGTSEMHFVAALDEVPEMRGILALFEGVATGAADGYARMAGKPAATLLHLGPGLGNGLANLHNARRAGSPVVSIVGDHAIDHKQYDTPLESDIVAAASNVSSWIRSSTGPGSVASDAADAVAAALGPPGQVATLILPADVCWLDAPGPAPPVPSAVPATDLGAITELSAVIRGSEPGEVVLLLGGRALAEEGLVAANQIATATGARLFCEVFPARLRRGAGVAPVDRLSYLGAFASAQIEGAGHVVLADAAEPASFFAYPDTPGRLTPEGAVVHNLTTPESDPAEALVALAEALGVGSVDAPVPVASRPELPTGVLDAQSVAVALGALLPADAIVSDEANTAGIFLSGATAGAPAHDWLCLTGGAIGQGLPVATGAAVACPDRKVVSVEADGSAMYTLQALWTQGREQLDVVTVILNNSSYAVLNMELDRVGASAAGARARAMLDIDRPDLDFVALGRGMGVESSRATTAEEFVDQLSGAVAGRGPRLIEAIVPSTL